jgi:hypothetical protein
LLLLRWFDEVILIALFFFSFLFSRGRVFGLQLVFNGQRRFVFVIVLLLVEVLLVIVVFVFEVMLHFYVYMMGR